jgi:tight adherence protein B
MNTLLFSLLVFVVVMLLMLLLYGAWLYVFDPRVKAKKQRLQAIHDAIHPGGQSSTSARSGHRDSALETWLRSRSGTFGRLERLAHRANSPLTAVRVAALMIALFMVVVAAGLLRQGNLALLLMLAAAIASTPLLWLMWLARKRRKAFDDKLPETLDYISRSLRAGHSLTSAIGMVGKEFADPTGQEFKTVFDEISFGISFKEAIGQLAERVKSDDLNFFVISLTIQHDTGGNLAELLDGLAKTIRERIKLRGKIRTLSAEGRISAMVLGAMPFAFAGIITLIRPVYISVLWSTPQGHMLLLIGGVLMAAGTLVLNRMTHIKV